MIANGSGMIIDEENKFPYPLFLAQSICYGLCRIEDTNEECTSSFIVSFCWKGSELPVSFRTKYTEHNSKIQVGIR